MAINISQIKTYRQLLKEVKVNICKALCYQEVAILFYDSICKII